MATIYSVIFTFIFSNQFENDHLLKIPYTVDELCKTIL